MIVNVKNQNTVPFGFSAQYINVKIKRLKRRNSKGPTLKLPSAVKQDGAKNIGAMLMRKELFWGIINCNYGRGGTANENVFYYIRFY